MSIFKFLGVLSPAHINFFSWRYRKERVGEDEFGNVYYRGKQRVDDKRERRWVMYKGAPEATKVPPEWHGWLHYQTNDVPRDDQPSFRRPWQKPHHPNMTGTSEAYRPAGHVLAEGQRPKATGDYEPWTPQQ